MEAVIEETSRFTLPDMHYSVKTNTLSNKVGEFQPQATVDYERYYPLRFCATAELLVKRRYSSCIETPEVIFLMPLLRLTQ